MGFVKGHAKVGGKKKGEPNKVTADIKQALAKHADAMVAELVRLATEAESEAVRVAAIKEIFDRSFGKASQPVETQVQLGISAELERLLQECDGQSRGLPPRANGPLLLTEAIPSSLIEPWATSQYWARALECLLSNRVAIEDWPALATSYSFASASNL